MEYDYKTNYFYEDDTKGRYAGKTKQDLQVAKLVAKYIETEMGICLPYQTITGDSVHDNHMNYDFIIFERRLILDGATIHVHADVDFDKKTVTIHGLEPGSKTVTYDLDEVEEPLFQKLDRLYKKETKFAEDYAKKYIEDYYYYKPVYWKILKFIKRSDDVLHYTIEIGKACSDNHTVEICIGYSYVNAYDETLRLNVYEYPPKEINENLAIEYIKKYATKVYGWIDPVVTSIRRSDIFNEHYYAAVTTLNDGEQIAYISVECHQDGLLVQDNKNSVPKFYKYNENKKGEIIMDYEKFVTNCKAIIRKYYEEHFSKVISANDIYVVWMAKVLQNNKALLSTTVVDGMYYEVTYNGDKNEIYFDAYHNDHNQPFNVDPAGNVDFDNATFTRSIK